MKERDSDRAREERVKTGERETEQEAERKLLFPIYCFPLDFHILCGHLPALCRRLIPKQHPSMPSPRRQSGGTSHHVTVRGRQDRGQRQNATLSDANDIESRAQAHL
jgi:hypothetical protein